MRTSARRLFVVSSSATVAFTLAVFPGTVTLGPAVSIAAAQATDPQPSGSPEEAERIAHTDTKRPMSSKVPEDPITVSPEELKKFKQEVRNTNNCPFRTTPPRPVDRSEEPSPGATNPAPLQVPAKSAGGDKMKDCGEILPPNFAVPEPLTASSWIVVDAISGDVVAAKDPHGRYRPASVIKVLLALVAIDELKLDQKLRATYDDAAIEGSRAGVIENNEYPVQLLLQGLLMNSGNDCGSVLVRALGGWDAATNKVNAKAKALGATDTRVANPTGLDAPGQTTSAFDLSLFYTAAFDNPVFRNLAGTRLATMPGNEEQHLESFEMSNDNQLLSSNFKGVLGGKTGYTEDARHTFVGAAERDGRRLIAVLLDAPATTNRPWQQAAALLDSGFSTPPQTSVGNLKLLAEQQSNDEEKGLPQPFHSGNENRPEVPEKQSADGNKNSTRTLWEFLWGKGGVIGVAILVILAAISYIVLSAIRHRSN